MYWTIILFQTWFGLQAGINPLLGAFDSQNVHCCLRVFLNIPIQAVGLIVSAVLYRAGFFRCT